MDGQLVYFQSAISPDAVRGSDAAAGGRARRGMKGGVGSGAMRRGARRGRGDAEDTVSGKQANEKECVNGGGVARGSRARAAESDVSVSMCCCSCCGSYHPNMKAVTWKSYYQVFWKCLCRYSDALIFLILILISRFRRVVGFSTIQYGFDSWLDEMIRYLTIPPMRYGMIPNDTISCYAILLWFIRQWWNIWQCSRIWHDTIPNDTIPYDPILFWFTRQWFDIWRYNWIWFDTIHAMKYYMMQFDFDITRQQIDTAESDTVQDQNGTIPHDSIWFWYINVNLLPFT